MSTGMAQKKKKSSTPSSRKRAGGRRSKTKRKTGAAGSKKPTRPEKVARRIGLGLTPPERACSDLNCPYHGSLRTRGAVLNGQVVSTKMQGTAVVRRSYLRYVQKYERFEPRASRFLAHSPPCIPVEEGDEVTIAECRKLSKHVSFVVVSRRERGGGIRRGEGS